MRKVSSKNIGKVSAILLDHHDDPEVGIKDLIDIFPDCDKDNKRLNNIVSICAKDILTDPSAGVKVILGVIAFGNVKLDYELFNEIICDEIKGFNVTDALMLQLVFDTWQGWLLDISPTQAVFMASCIYTLFQETIRQGLPASTDLTAFNRARRYMMGSLDSLWNITIELMHKVNSAHLVTYLQDVSIDTTCTVTEIVCKHFGTDYKNIYLKMRIGIASDIISSIIIKTEQTNQEACKRSIVLIQKLRKKFVSWNLEKSFESRIDSPMWNSLYEVFHTILYSGKRIPSDSYFLVSVIDEFEIPLEFLKFRGYEERHDTVMAYLWFKSVYNRCHKNPMN